MSMFAKWKEGRCVGFYMHVCKYSGHLRLKRLELEGMNLAEIGVQRGC
jgi:hypothetical protein